METKICINCNKKKPLQKFKKMLTSLGNASYTNKCGACIARIYKFYKKTGIRVYFPKPEIVPTKETAKTKICFNCETEKSVRAFSKYNRTDGTVGRCAKCHTCKNKNSKSIAKYSPYEKDGLLVKFCKRCERVKPVTEFNKTSGKITLCKKCNCEASSAYNHRKRCANKVVPFSKADIIKRDGLNCYLCDKLLTVKTAVIEHVMPLSRGGDHKPENAKIACLNCNSKKGTKTLTEYKKYRGDYVKPILNAPFAP